MTNRNDPDRVMEISLTLREVASISIAIAAYSAGRALLDPARFRDEVERLRDIMQKLEAAVKGDVE